MTENPFPKVEIRPEWHCADQARRQEAPIEPALARMQDGNTARKSEMAAELIAEGFSPEQVRRLLHLDAGASHRLIITRKEE